MSIASEINRLQQAKSDLAASITNKGVTVPAATTIDGYAALVDQIQGGGGLQPYKTITLAESHESDSIGNPVYWAQYLELPIAGSTPDSTLYVVVFEGNNARSTYRTDFEVFYYASSKHKYCLDVRNSRTNIKSESFSTNRSSWASTGTVIKCYRF